MNQEQNEYRINSDDKNDLGVENIHRQSEINTYRHVEQLADNLNSKELQCMNISSDHQEKHY